MNTCLQEGFIFLPPAESHSDGEVDIAAKESRPEVASCPAGAVREISPDIIGDDDDDDGDDDDDDDLYIIGAVCLSVTKNDHFAQGSQIQ